MKNCFNISYFKNKWFQTSLIILYFSLICSVPLLAQENHRYTSFYRIGPSISSSNNISYGNYYLMKPISEDISFFNDLKGVEVVKKLLNNSYIVLFDSLEEINRSKLLKYVSIYPVNDFWKTSNITKISDNSILHGDYLVQVTDELQWHEFINSESKINAIKLQDGLYSLTIVRMPVSKLLNKSFITYIEKRPSITKSKFNVLDLNLHPNRINTIQAYFTYLNGAGELISLKEPFYDTSDIDITGRYVNTETESEFIDNHALEMVTIISGNGNSSLTGLGVAPKSFHTSSSNEDVIPNPIEYFTANGINTQNHSYGTGVESFYGVGASLYDQQVYKAPHILHVFSAGNAGLESADHGRYQDITGYANITGNFKLAKNVLTVGAVDTTMNTIVLNSNGPAFDGRIKPELVSYSMTGTSNSAAYVSGVSLLLQQAYRQKYSTDMPSSLAKAFLINSADNIGALGPDHKTGYGSLNAYEAILQLEDEHFIQDKIEFADVKKYKIAVPENAVNFKATLVWTDLPANPNDEIALINNLNIQVLEGTNHIHLPWVLSTEPNIESLEEPAKKGKDHLNNIEQVHITKVESDTIEIVVSSQNPLDSSQAFSIVYDWEIENDFRWTSPTYKDNIPYNGETVSHLRWESSYSANQTGNLYYKMISEEGWQLIEKNIPLKTENYRWDPEIVNDHAQLKMEVIDKTYLSDTFSISAPLRLKVGFDCTDSLSFYWKSIDAVDYYKLFNLEESEMKSFLSTQDTSVTINKSDLSSSFFKVQAFKNNKPLIQGGAIDLNLQASNCFLEAYFVEAVQGEGIYHNILLSSLTGVDKIQIQKRNELENSWDLLADLDANAFDLEYIEEQPINGFNESRVVINFSNGESVISQTQSTYFVNDADFILYPNPLLINQDLKVFAKEAKPDAFITFYNLQGLEIISFPIPNDRNFLDVNSFQEGLYIYRIRDEENQFAQGKVLIRN